MSTAKLIERSLLILLFMACGASVVQAQKKSSRNPHGLINIPCENCHTNTSWKPIRAIPEFDHNRTRYPLLGMHAKVDCKQCHTNLNFTNISTRCADCHADLHRGQFGSNCEQCHTVAGWQVKTQQLKDHLNRFPLLGVHAMLDCADCHKSAAVGQFQGLSTACLSCHTTDYQSALNPNHKTLNFPTTCESCHSADTWFDAKFDHLKYTGYALTGAHATLACTACHIGGKFAGTPADCYSCHVTQFTTAKNPDHVKAGLPQQCQFCHNTTSWLNATFDHNRFTNFPLTGAHVNVPCATCHTDNYAGTLPTNCYGCHAPDYNKTATMPGIPNHVAGNFPQDCSVCHSTSTWLGATFDHNKTAFPLTGAHTSVPCTTCHTDNYAGTLPTSCFGCHQPDYNKTANMPGIPNHVTLGYPQDCTMCHTTTTWLNATFNHNNTPFPLTGAHVNVPCASCHIGGVFAGTPTDCYSCHKADYNGTTNPNHASVGFPTTCATCHTTASWLGATFNHTWFPMNHGGANGVCATCHTNPSNYAIFTCTNCHQQAQTNQRHQGIQGYVYNSVNCYACHKNGGGGG
jgi:hypothetical protein